MSRLVNVTVVLLLLFTTGSVCTALAQQAQMTAAAATTESDRARDGLAGPVRRIKTEMAKLSNKTGNPVEGQRQVLETVAYDIKGNKTENAYYPVSSANLTGKETYKYDEKGNISEMTLLNEDGTLLSKEVYAYEFDFFGNWTKMTTSVAVIENSKLSFEPTEVTYRAISYFLDEATLAKMAAQQAAPQQQVAQSRPAPSTGSNNATASNNAGVKQDVAKLDQPQPKPAAPGNQPTATETIKSSHASQPAAAAEDKPAPTQNVAQNQSAPQNNSAPVSTAATPKSEPAKDDSSETAIPVPEAPGPKPLLKPISGGVLNGSAVSLPKPSYPDQARNARAQGVVVVEVIIDVNGKVISARAISGHMLLQQAAVQAAYQARFSPTTLSGRPVKVAGTINYNFALAK